MVKCEDGREDAESKDTFTCEGPALNAAGTGVKDVAHSPESAGPWVLPNGTGWALL